MGRICGTPTKVYEGTFVHYTGEDHKTTGWAEGSGGTRLRFFQLGHDWYENGRLVSIVEFPADRKECPADTLCLYRGFDYADGGYWVSGTPNIPHLAWFGFNDVLSSWANNTGRDYCWYSDSDSDSDNDYGGSQRLMHAGQSDRALTGEHQNDEASSVRAATTGADGSSTC
ncbi:peptidase inhibitor family I36 protein [Streptomyces sp. NPDC051567]|uniref:peptidase inhibitor family I36 protein n=1 Tax=Streptomyces sp. NPDC051567 TaxID=3365660 RepID=UPI0037BC7A85